jgi:hypothetical protein
MDTTKRLKTSHSVFMRLAQLAQHTVTISLNSVNRLACVKCAQSDFSAVGSTFNYTVELGYNGMKGTEYFVSLQTSVVITE